MNGNIFSNKKISFHDPTVQSTQEYAVACIYNIFINVISIPVRLITLKISARSCYHVVLSSQAHEQIREKTFKINVIFLYVRFICRSLMTSLASMTRCNWLTLRCRFSRNRALLC